MAGSKEKNFPPRKLQDLPLWSASHFVSLCRAMEDHPVTLVLGAGVSASAGLPTWEAFLSRIVATYFVHWNYAKDHGEADNQSPPGNMSIAFWEDCFQTEEIRNIAGELVKQQDPLRLAQLIKARVRPIDWNYLFRKALYGDADSLPEPSPLIQGLVDLAIACRSRVAVVNYNYDNLVEEAFKASGVPCSPVWELEKTVPRDRIPVYHPHGYVRLGGNGSTSPVLGEEDYNIYSVDQYGWRNTVQLRAFTSTVCIFVGFSLTDPQVRRLLWVSKCGGGPRHFAFLPSHTGANAQQEMLESLFDAQLRDGLSVHAIRYPVGGDHSRLTSLIGTVSETERDSESLWLAESEHEVQVDHAERQD